VATGGGPLSGPASTASTKGTKSKAAKKNKPSRAEKVSVSSFDDSELEAKVLAFLEASPGSRVEALTEGLKARPDAIRRVVARLFEQKKLTRKGKTRGTKYSLTPKG
jgi:predicted HTH transcriptional regulator